jgi:phage shock protein A
MSDTGIAMQRAQDKIESMQARAGAMDELLQSGTLNDLTGSSDPLQAELDKSSQSSAVELELAQLKGQLGASTSPAGAIGSTSDDEPTDVEPVDAEPVDAEPVGSSTTPASQGKSEGSDDLFSLGSGS